MLQAIGSILHYAEDKGDKIRHSHIRAYILRDNLDDLRDWVSLNLPWGEIYHHKVEYTNLPQWQLQLEAML